MADELQLNPESLRHAAGELADHGESLVAVHQRSRAETADAQSGWVGSSAGELSGLLGRWETATTAHIGRIGAHSCDMQFTAAEFIFMEERNKSALASVSGASPSDDPSMR